MGATLKIFFSSKSQGRLRGWGRSKRDRVVGDGWVRKKVIVSEITLKIINA